jgi:hypothetical protein
LTYSSLVAEVVVVRTLLVVVVPVGCLRAEIFP